jgi:septum site-determining protein MinC
MVKGYGLIRLGTGRVTLFRGKGLGLELVFAGREFRDAFEELEARLAERPGFYRGTSAVVNFGTTLPSSEELEEIRALLSEAGIELLGVSTASEETEPAPARASERRRFRASEELTLSDGARSLVADFAGARSDIAERRRRGAPSVARPPAPAQPALHLVESPPGTLYHCTTLRGGQALHHPGNIVVVGDVNPGAELVAAGDIVVFGRLAGVAHAGAQGDENARVYAIDLDATQLRIATFIAADTESAASSPSRPQVAMVRAGRITLAPIDHLGELEQRGTDAL